MQVRQAAAVVTGGASGLGAGCVRVLSEAGARVSIFDTDESRGQEMAAKCGARYECVDVVDESSVQAGLDRAALAHGPARIIINCAGIPGGGMRVSGREGPHPLPFFRRMLDVHVVGTFNLMRLGATMLSKATVQDDGERGVIINTSSAVSLDGPVGMIAYGAAKGAIDAMTLPAARDLGPVGIRVNCIVVGLFDTPMSAGAPPEHWQRVMAMQPFPKRMGTPAEFAALARHICENPMLNGAALRLDGGLRLHVAG
jgi:NAD(P)-dependent dehydrogenase (short-subunit alcohol dehydrogenase family)